MTPGARIAAAIGVLDRVLAGEAAEKALIAWARGSRYAGSGDRAAVRDHVFDALRCRRSFAALGGADTGRGLMIGMVRAGGGDPAGVFTGEGHAPGPLTADEAAALADPGGLPELDQLDCPDWLAPSLRAALGADFAPVMETLRHRAPVHLRVNLGEATRDEAVRRLAGEGIEAVPHPLAATALEVTGGERRLRSAPAFAEGLVELQDAASQAVVLALEPVRGLRVLDYCAGGGGKALALAALGARVTAHDADPRRMADLPARAARAGTEIPTIATADVARVPPFDLVFADAPCSGSGAWRRQPEAKWRLTPERLAELTRIQGAILDAAGRLVAPGGRLAYATCSLLGEENEATIEGFLHRNGAWHEAARRRFTPLDGGDGFFVAILKRD